MGNIFISYRREDSIATAGRLRDKLVQAFGRNRVFVDVDDIPPGANFVRILDRQVKSCQVLLAVIGPDWLGASDADGNRRLDNAEDFVGLELQTALSTPEITVIPILVDGARMPKASELPRHLERLTRRNAIELHNTQFGSDSDRLVAALKTVLRQQREPLSTYQKIAMGIGVASLAVAAATIGVQLVGGWGSGRPSPEQSVVRIEPRLEPAPVQPTPARAAACGSDEIEKDGSCVRKPAPPAQRKHCDDDEIERDGKCVQKPSQRRPAESPSRPPRREAEAPSRPEKPSGGGTCWSTQTTGPQFVPCSDPRSNGRRAF